MMSPSHVTRMTFVLVAAECMKSRLPRNRSKKTAMTRNLFHTVWPRTSHVREKRRTWYTFATTFPAKVIKHSVFLKLTVRFWDSIPMIIADLAKEVTGMLKSR